MARQNGFPISSMLNKGSSLLDFSGGSLERFPNPNTYSRIRTAVTRAQKGQRSPSSDEWAIIIVGRQRQRESKSQSDNRQAGESEREMRGLILYYDFMNDGLKGVVAALDHPTIGCRKLRGRAEVAQFFD